MPHSLSARRVGLRVEGHGPSIVLLHSSMSSKNQWRELIESLRDRYRLIAIDLLGYGESAMPSSCESYSLRDEVGLVESVLARELKRGERFHLIGHSFGGVIALQLAALANPGRIRSLSLFEPIAFHLLPTGDPDLVPVEEGWREIERRFDADDAPGAAACFVDYWSGTGAFAQLRDTQQSALAGLVRKVLLELRAVADEWGFAKYQRIDVPTLLVAGSESPEPARRLTAMLADMLPNATRVEVAAGHMAPITHPALINPIFEEFVRSADSSPAWHDRARAVAFGLAGIAMSFLPLFATQSIGGSHDGPAPGATYPLEEDAWHPAPPGMPAGGRYAVMSGDPLLAGPFVMRVRLPPGYALPPYRRENEEQLIILAGSLMVGTRGGPGETHVRTLNPGSFVSLPADEVHYAKTQNGAIVQIVGTGPFAIEYTEQASRG